MTIIEIGGGTLAGANAINLDSRHGYGPWQREAQDTPWPTGDSTIDHVRASHVLEHVPAGEDRITIFNEVWRVLKPGGTFEVILPLIITDTGLPSWHSIADPTHVSYWCRESFHYFTARHDTSGRHYTDAVFAANADYGLRLFFETHWSVSQGFEGHWHGTPAGK